ncbi:hypothetical protein ACHAO7_011150 [Fusarium culmorum]
MAGNKLLVYLLRRDLRTIDNPILHHLATFDHDFTHLLPIYIDDTKLAAFLAMGCLSARSIHTELAKFEAGSEQEYSQAVGFGRGENEGTRAVRLELLWRDYMRRLCIMKFGVKIFSIHGYKGSENYNKEWKTANKEMAARDQDPPPDEVAKIIDRFLRGTTGMGFIDASQRELVLTGFISNRARQNVASFFAKHLSVDWRYMAEWHEQNLVDYDVSSNWSNWVSIYSPSSLVDRKLSDN